MTVRKFSISYYVIFIAKILKQLELIPMKLTGVLKVCKKPLPHRRRLTRRELPPTILPKEVEKSNFSPKILEFMSDIGIIWKTF